MKKLLILMMLSGVVASCTRDSACSVSIGAHPKNSKHLRAVRRNLRINYHHHQTRVGKFFNINIF